jgi:hypothetical protein
MVVIFVVVMVVGGALWVGGGSFCGDLGGCLHW